MIFKKLILKNIRSYNNLEIEFPEGTTLLSGDIGAGKTSILLGLQFALFGLQPGQKGTSILRNGEEIARAILEMEVDGRDIRIERGIKKSSSGSITQDVNILCVEGRREELSTSEMKTKVIQILNYPKEFAKKSNLLYKYTVYTPQEGMKEIIEERPEVRLDILRHIFGIDRYKRIKENTQTFLQKIKESIRIKEVLANELNFIKEKLTNVSENKIKLVREINNLNIEHNISKEKQNTLTEKISESEKELEEERKLRNDLAENKTTLIGKKDLEERLKKEIFQMQSQMGKEIKFSSEQLHSTTKLLEDHRKNLEELSSKLIATNSRISVLNSLKTKSQEIKEKVNSLDNCPTCHQTVSSDHKEKMAKKTQYEIEDLDRELEQKIMLRSQINRDIEKEKEISRNYEKDLDELKQAKIRFEHQKTIDTKIKSDSFVLDRTQNEISVLEERISTLTDEIGKYSDARETYTQRKKELDEISEQTKKEEIQLATKNKEVELLKKRIDELNEEILEKEKVREQINYLRSLQDWLQAKFLSMIDLTERNVMAKLRTDFSNLFSEWFTLLVPEGLSAKLDEDFTPQMINEDYELEYDFLSGGERTAVALAYRLALNQILNSMLSKIKTKDIVLLDEPTDGFSAEQLDKMRDLFEEINSDQVILVSHEQKIEGFVDHVIRIKKEGTSHVESSTA